MYHEVYETSGQLHVDTVSVWCSPLGSVEVCCMYHIPLTDPGSIPERNIYLIINAGVINDCSFLIWTWREMESKKKSVLMAWTHHRNGH